MEHNTCRENLSAYLDGELPREERLSLESHLAGCHDCSRELAELKSVSAIIKKHVMEPVPRALKDAVFSEPRAKSGFFSWLKPAAAFAAVAAGLFIILALPRIREREQAASPALFSNAYRAEGAAQADLAAKSGEFAGDSAASEAGVRGAGVPRYAAPSSRKTGTFGQAKFAGGARSAGAAVSALAGASAGGTGLSAFSEAGAVRAKRAAPVTVPDILANGVRFRASHWREGAAKPRNGGSIRAFDARSGELLWEARVYEKTEDPRLEAGVQQVHISALALNGEKLEITDERGNRYRLDISTRKVEALPR